MSLRISQRQRSVGTKLAGIPAPFIADMRGSKVRAAVGLPDSSNPVEKANDELVSERQKHHGMAWSKLGSYSLATITALSVNGALGTWAETGKVDLRNLVSRWQMAHKRNGNST